MKKSTKALLLTLCAVALVIGSLVGTLAYLTDSEAVTNTFTVGKVGIILDETDTDGSKTNVTTESRDRGNKYHLIPGQTYTKDPLITVNSDSDECWLFVKVENDIADIESSDNTIAAQMTANGWTEIDATNHIYAHKDVAKAKDTVKVFESFKIDGDSVDGAKLDAYKEANITVTAYAVQKAGFDTAKAAWDATFGAPVTP